MVERNENAGIAFIIVTLSGLSTAVGAAIVFFPSLVKYANQRLLGSSMGLSAGVMLYVSFNDISIKAYDSFVEAGHGERGAAFYSTGSFFLGIVFMTFLNILVQAISGHHGHHHHDDHQHDHHTTRGTKKGEQSIHLDVPDGSESSSSALSFEVGCPCTSEDPAGDLERVKNMANEIETYENGPEGQPWMENLSAHDNNTVGSSEEDGESPFNSRNCSSQVSTLVSRSPCTISPRAYLLSSQRWRTPRLASSWPSQSVRRTVCASERV